MSPLKFKATSTSFSYVQVDLHLEYSLILLLPQLKVWTTCVRNALIAAYAQVFVCDQLG